MPKTPASTPVHVWEQMKASPWALRVLRTGYRLVWGETKAPLITAPVSFPLPVLPQAKAVLDSEVETLLDKGAISLVQNCSTPGFYCRLFTVPKHTWGFRPVLDLSPLNVYLRHIKFKMETVNTVRQTILHKDWSVSLDLSDAFFPCPSAQQGQKVAEVCLERHRVPVQCPPIRSQPVTLGLHAHGHET